MPKITNVFQTQNALLLLLWVDLASLDGIYCLNYFKLHFEKYIWSIYQVWYFQQKPTFGSYKKWLLWSNGATQSIAYSAFPSGKQQKAHKTPNPLTNTNKPGDGEPKTYISFSAVCRWSRRKARFQLLSNSFCCFFSPARTRSTRVYWHCWLLPLQSHGTFLFGNNIQRREYTHCIIIIIITKTFTTEREQTRETADR